MLDSLDAAIGMNTLQLNGQLDLQTADVDGILTMDLPTVADLARAVSLDWRPSGAVTVLGQLDGRWPAPRLAATLSGVGRRRSRPFRRSARRGGPARR